MTGNVYEAPLNEDTLSLLVSLSADWEKENSCHGYRKNTEADIAGNRIFLAQADGQVIGYLFGHLAEAEKTSSIMQAGKRYFEIEELYVRPEKRSRGVGKRLFEYAEALLRGEGEADFILLSTATKNWRAILHFYLDELDMSFWSARLFKPLHP